MRKQNWTAILQLTVALCGTLAVLPVALGAAAPELAGTYSLLGGGEARSGLELKPNGRFSFGIIFGGYDGHAEGQWSLKDGEVVLTNDEKPAPAFSWLPDQTSHADFCKLDDGEQTEMPVALVACVLTPELKLHWTGVEMTAEFANGRRRSGFTRYGKLAFLARTEPEWAGVPLTKLTVAYPSRKVPPRTFDVPPEAKAVVIHLAPGSIFAPYFNVAYLRIVESDEGDLELELFGDDRSRSVGRYVRTGEAR